MTGTDTFDADFFPDYARMEIPEGAKTFAFHEKVFAPQLTQGILPTASTAGSYVAVRHVNEKITRLGLYLGDLPTGMTAKLVDGELRFAPTSTNPCIYVFDLGLFVYGKESWWSEIKSPDDLKQITDADIENVWYVQALKALSETSEVAE